MPTSPVQAIDVATLRICIGVDALKKWPLDPGLKNIRMNLFPARTSSKTEFGTL